MKLGWRSVAPISICFTTIVLVLVQRPPRQCPAGGRCGDLDSEQTISKPNADPTSAASSKPADLREIRDPASFEALVYVPPGSGPFPLLLYLHGAGEMGGSLRDILSEGATGTPPVALATGKALPILATRFVMVAPHSHHGWDPTEIAAFTDFLLSERAGLNLDRSRLYVTGHSMGGYGALAAATTGRFAAVVPVAGSGSPDPSRLRGVAVWAFHGRNDVIVPSETSEDVIASLHQLGVNTNDAKITLYDEAPAPPGWPDYFGHASTIPAYATEELYHWLLARHLT